MKPLHDNIQILTLLSTKFITTSLIKIDLAYETLLQNLSENVN